MSRTDASTSPLPSRTALTAISPSARNCDNRRRRSAGPTGNVLHAGQIAPPLGETAMPNCVGQPIGQHGQGKCHRRCQRSPHGSSFKKSIYRDHLRVRNSGTPLVVRGLHSMTRSSPRSSRRKSNEICPVQFNRETSRVGKLPCDRSIHRLEGNAGTMADPIGRPVTLKRRQATIDSDRIGADFFAGQIGLGHPRIGLGRAKPLDGDARRPDQHA